MAGENGAGNECDPVKDRLIKCAGACLEHIRKVKWGTATSQYQVTSDELIIQVSIEVKCFERNPEATTNGR